MLVTLRRSATTIGAIISSFAILAVSNAAMAFSVSDTGLDTTARAAHLQTSATLPAIAGNLIGALLALVGVVFMVLMIYGGFLWMSAQGNEQQVDKAKSLITSAIIGIIIVASGYAITSFVLSQTLQATSTGGGGDSGGGAPASDSGGSGGGGSTSGGTTSGGGTGATGGGGTGSTASCRPRSGACPSGETPDPENPGWCCSGAGGAGGAGSATTCSATGTDTCKCAVGGTPRACQSPAACCASCGATPGSGVVYYGGSIDPTPCF